VFDPFGNFVTKKTTKPNNPCHTPGHFIPQIFMHTFLDVPFLPNSFLPVQRFAAIPASGTHTHDANGKYRASQESGNVRKIDFGNTISPKPNGHILATYRSIFHF